MFGIFNKNKNAIDVNELDEMIGAVDIIDIREPYEFRAKCIRTAKNVPMSKLLDRPERYLKGDRPYYLVCYSGSRSKSAARYLAARGFNVYNAKGGMRKYTGKNRVYK